MKIAVLGGGGFIGHHLVKRLKDEGHWVRAVDVKPPDFEASPADEFCLFDLRLQNATVSAVLGVDEVYNLAADMGGLGHITFNDADIIRNNTYISLNTLEACRQQGVQKLIYTSSACVYPNYRQEESHVIPLAEDMVMPADPQHLYGWEKLTTEKALAAYHEAGWMDVRIARLHNIYGPLGTWDGGREKAPAALCRKVAQAEDGGSIDIWGDGQATRSFCWIDDCLDGILRLAKSTYTKPLNIGSSELITINDLADMIIRLSGKTLTKNHVEGPEGVRGRNSDNSRIRTVLAWEPTTPLEKGLGITYEWVKSQVEAANGKD